MKIIERNHNAVRGLKNGTVDIRNVCLIKKMYMHIQYKERNKKNKNKNDITYQTFFLYRLKTSFIVRRYSRH